MISFGNAASSHRGLIPLKTGYKKRVELLWVIASMKNFINFHSAAFFYSFCTQFGPRLQILHFLKKSLDKFFINLKIPRSIVNKYTLQVSRTLKTRKAFKQGLKYDQFSPQISCLQLSVLIIHWHCLKKLLVQRNTTISEKT